MRRKIWPQLAAIALNICAVPAIADESERLFSQAGGTISPQRRRLSHDSVASLIRLNSWQSSGIIKIDKSFFELATEAAAAAEDETTASGSIATQQTQAINQAIKRLPRTQAQVM